MSVFFLLVHIPMTAQEISLPEEFRPQLFDVISYDARIRFETVTDKKVSGVVRMAVRWKDPSSSPVLFVHLLDLTLDSSFVRSSRVTPLAETVGLPAGDSMHYYRYMLPHSVAANDVDTLVMYYSGTMMDEGGSQPWGGVHFDDEVLYAMGVGFHSSQVSETQHWMPCYDHPSDKAKFHATFDVPAGYDVASVGLRGHDTVVAGRRLVEWSTAEDFSTYLLTFAVAHYALLRSSESIVPIEIYTLPSDTASAHISFKLLPRMIRTLANRFGPYPFEKVGYCATRVGAMEHQTMISFPVSLIQRRDTINDVAAHELAHQWFGDLVTPLDYRHVWLTESFATYAENLWREELHGKLASVNLMKGRVDNYIGRIASIEGVFSLFNFPRADPSSNYPETIYQKGAVVLGMLRQSIGDSAFFTGLRSYLLAHYNANAVTSDMKSAMETASGANLTDFFDQWVYGKGWPKVEVDYRRIGLGWEVVIRQVQHLTDPALPLFTTLPINVKYTNNDDVNIDTVLQVNASGELTFRCKKPLGINNGSLLRSLMEIVRTTGIDETGDVVRRITISPNPAIDSFVLERSTFAAPATVSVVDVEGHTLLTKVIDAGNAKVSIQIDALPTGAYFVHVIENGKSLSVPLVITR